MAQREKFLGRAAPEIERLEGLLRDIYIHDDRLERELSGLIDDAAASWLARSDELKALDEDRLADPAWFQSNRMLGGVCYVDRYAGTLAALHTRIPYFSELGLAYLHVMPIFLAPAGNSDGGYAVSSYRDINPAIGTMSELRDLGHSLRQSGISLAVDFVFNHTSNEHDWAQRAKRGDSNFADFYWIYEDRTMPDRFELTTREIFPEDHPGSFVQMDDGRWVWTTFHSFQWDLNYSNPAVFRAMAREMLFLANQGVEILRMDAVAFIWKKLGTTCENLPEAHLLLQAFNAVCRIAAPSVLFLSEAIVHPNEVAKYMSVDECQLSYNPLQMALIWNSLATRDTGLLSQALERRHEVPPGTAWVNYVRSHDDIGWTFADEDAAELGIDAYSHRQFLNRFYVDRYPGSFARGLPFQDNEKTGDSRVSGTTASLAGLEAGDPLAVSRIVLAHSIIMSTGGIPLIYLGDEVGQLNDHQYTVVEATRDDSRWAGRPYYPKTLYATRVDQGTNAGAIFRSIRRLIAVRCSHPEFAGGNLVPFDTKNPHVLGFQRMGLHANSGVIVFANFGDDVERLDAQTLSGLPPNQLDLVTDQPVSLGNGLALAPHQFVWLSRVRLARHTASA